MRSLSLISLLAILFLSCKKDNTPDTGTASAYINVNAGSTWTYEETNNDTGTPATSTYTITSTDHDTTVNSKKYHVYNNSRGDHWFLNNTNGEYYQFDSIPGLLGGGVFDRLYLKSNIDAGANWTQTVTIDVSGFPLPVTLTNTVTEKGITRTVNSINYENVIHLTTSIAVTGVPSSAISTSIESYYAEGTGLIENTTQVSINFGTVVQQVDLKTRLLSANLK